MAWRDSLRPASFRGVSFGVTSAEDKKGRATQTHIFITREPYVEDLGEAPRVITFQAFVLGPDYMDKRDQLEKALDEPGSGTLVHPWYGELTVTVSAPYSVTHTAEAGGMAVYTLTFTKSVPPDSPTTDVHAPTVLEDRSDSLLDSIGGYLDNAVSFVGDVQERVENVVSCVQEYAAKVQGYVGMITGPAAKLASELMALTPDSLLRRIGISGTLSGLLSGLFDWGETKDSDGTLLSASSSGSGVLSLTSATASLSSLSSPVALASRVAQSSPVALARAYALLAIATSTPVRGVSASAGKARTVREQDTHALDVWMQSMSTVSACRLLAVSVPNTRSEVLALRKTVSACLDVAQAHAPDMVYSQLSGLRSVTAKVIADSAGRAPDVRVISPDAALSSRVSASGDTQRMTSSTGENSVETGGVSVVLPSLVLAYRFTGGIAVDADMVLRNDIAHPGFVPVGPLEVLDV